MFMDYVCGPVILYSQDKIRMMDFLCDVFEFEVDVKNDTVSNGNLYLKLVEFEKKYREEFKSTGIVFAFKLKDPDQLKEIINKYNFFIYRKSSVDHSTEAWQVDQKEHGKSLSIKDIDGRTWRFDFENPL